MSEHDENRARSDHYRNRRYDVEHESEAYVLERQRRQRWADEEKIRNSKHVSYPNNFGLMIKVLSARKRNYGPLNKLAEINLFVIIGVLIVMAMLAQIFHI